MLSCSLIAYNSQHIEFFMSSWKVERCWDKHLTLHLGDPPWCLPRVSVRSSSETKRCWLLVGYYFHCMCHGLSNGGWLPQQAWMVGRHLCCMGMSRNHYMEERDTLCKHALCVSINTLNICYAIMLVQWVIFGL